MRHVEGPAPVAFEEGCEERLIVWGTVREHRSYASSDTTTRGPCCASGAARSWSWYENIVRTPASHPERAR
jgi:hypothetical protein